MKLKGTIVMELTDVNTGEVTTIMEENMVTNAVNDILGTNPMGVFYCEAEYSTGVVWTGNLLPICPNMIGGILVFPKALEERADNIYPLSDNLPVAYASNDVNATANTARGSLNLTESKALDNGYKFVWEFTPSQGNGTIAAVALTSRQGGENGFGSLVGAFESLCKKNEMAGFRWILLRNVDSYWRLMPFFFVSFCELCRRNFISVCVYLCYSSFVTSKNLYTEEEMSINEIIEKVAEMNNTTAEEVYAEMQMAINAGFRNPDPQVQKEWEKVSYRGMVRHRKM